MHHPLVGPFSKSRWGSRPKLTKKFAQIIEGFNVISILHGHWHVPGHYEWNDVDANNTGSIKHGAPCFGVVHVTDHAFTFASWNSRQKDWWWWHSKPINGCTTPDAGEILDVQVKNRAIGRPATPYPTGTWPPCKTKRDPASKSTRCLTKTPDKTAPSVVTRCGNTATPCSG